MAASCFLAAILFFLIVQYLQALQVDAEPIHPFAYSLACALSVTFLCGMLPALRATRDGLSGTLAKNSGTQVSGRTPVQWIFAGVQVALAVTLLIGAGLLQRSLSELARVSPGFDPAHVLTLHISASWGETSDMKNLAQHTNRILDALRAVPE